MCKLKPLIVHAKLIKSGSLERALHNNLMSLYSKDGDGDLSSALRLFKQLPFKPTVVSWTSIISAHSNLSPSSSLSLFLSMLRTPQTLPNQATLSSLLKTFSSCFAFCLQLHALSHKLSLTTAPFSGSALVHVYASNAFPDDALKVFDEITQRDEVCYCSAIVGLAQNDRPVDSIRLFNRMRSDAFQSNIYGVSGVLRALANLAVLEPLRAVHAHSIITALDLDFVVGTALVDAYGKSGVVLDARRVFDLFVHKSSLVTWNTMLAAYAHQGDAGSSKQLFDEMTGRHKFVTDEYTFLAILTACSNASLVDETAQWLDIMRSEHGVEPCIEHYTCLVAAMSRVGNLEDAERYVSTMPCMPDAAVWRALLSGCMVHRNVAVGQRVAEKLMELDPRDDSAYVILANLYAGVGMKDERGEVWLRMKERGARKETGRSWIELKGQVHEFIAGDMKHELTMEIQEKVRELTNLDSDIVDLFLSMSSVELWEC